MTFSCPNYRYDTDLCDKLKQSCLPGRPGCVLEGKVKLSKAVLKQLDELAESKRRK